MKICKRSWDAGWLDGFRGSRNPRGWDGLSYSSGRVEGLAKKEAVLRDPFPSIFPLKKRQKKGW